MSPLIREYAGYVPFNPIEYVWIDFASGPMPTDESAKALSEKLRAFPYGLKNTTVNDWPLPFEKTCLLLPVITRGATQRQGVMIVTLERANGRMIFQLWTNAEKDRGSILITTTNTFESEFVHARVSNRYADSMKKSLAECANHGRQVLTVALRRIVALALLGDSDAVAAKPAFIGSETLNRKRIKKGKRPFFEWTTIEVKPASPSVPQGGTHASPKPHMRRGHVRRLKSGKIVTIKSMIVNKHKMPEEGFVFHDYVMATATTP